MANLTGSTALSRDQPRQIRLVRPYYLGTSHNKFLFAKFLMSSTLKAVAVTVMLTVMQIEMKRVKIVRIQTLSPDH